jgi:acyl-CoA synthetase (AMP-forming)/AMP-acid ligase II
VRCWPAPTSASRGTGSSRRDHRALAGGWFHTGDGGLVDDDGYLVIQDRKKDVIITGGENVSSIEVEDAIFSHPDVAEVAVIGVPDERWGETIKALVVKAEGSALTERELIDYVKGKVARYKAPTSVEFRDILAGRPPASCRSSSCARRTGRAASARSN